MHHQILITDTCICIQVILKLKDYQSIRSTGKMQFVLIRFVARLSHAITFCAYVFCPGDQSKLNPEPVIAHHC